MNNIKVISSTFKLHLSQSFARATFRFCIIFQPLIYTFILYMMYSNSGIENYINNVILGSGLCSLWSAICFSSAGDIERERYMGTLENIFCCPSKFTTIMFGKILANTFLGLTGMILSIAFTKIFFNKGLVIANPAEFTMSFILMLFSFVCVSLLICPIFTLSKNARALMNCLEYPIFIIGGFVFPVSMLPAIIKPISYIFSPMWAIEILKESAAGIIDMKMYFIKAALLISISLIYIIISRFLFKKIDKKTRIEGTLGVS